MSFGNIGNNLFGASHYNSPLSNAAPELSNANTAAPQDQTSEYRGGTIKVEVTANDTQQTVARKAVFAHAKTAGLSDAQANDFADQWIAANASADGKTYLYNLNGGNLAGLTDKEFEAIKAKGEFEDTLSPVIHHRAIANINARLWDEQNPAPPLPDSEVITIETKERLTSTEQVAAKSGIDNTAITKAEINSRYDQPPMSAREASTAESLSNAVTDGLDSVTGTDPSGIGAAINRQTVSAIRATGRILEAVGATETGQTLQRANSEVTRRDSQAEALVQKSGVNVPLIARIGKDADKLAENVLDGLETAIKGDFSDNPSTGATIGRVVGGLHPAGDVRDIVANAQDVAENKKGSYVGLGGAVLGTVIPGAGDAAKAGIRANKEAISEGAEALLKQTDAVAEAAAKQVDEVTTQAAKEAERITTRYNNEITQNGHAVQRHGKDIAEQQLEDRAMRGIDPITGTTDDASRKNADGTPKQHKSGKDSTKFNSKEALVKAEEYIKNSREYEDALKEAVVNNRGDFVIKDIKLENIYGANYRDNVFGKTRIGSKSNPIGTTETDFTDGTIKAIYQKDTNESWKLETIYPEPK